MHHHPVADVHPSGHRSGLAHHHHQHSSSGALAAALPSISPGRGASSRRGGPQQGGPSLSRASRCDSSSSVASLLFDFEDEDASGGKDAPSLRLHPDLQQLADLAAGQDGGMRSSTQAALWMDALDARNKVTEEARRNEEEGGCAPGGSAFAAAAQESLPLQHRASAPLPPAAASNTRDAASSDLSFLSGSAGMAALSLRSVGSTRLPSGGGNSSTAAASADSVQAVDIRKFAKSLAERGHCTWVRSGMYTCPPESGMGAIRHRFVVVSAPGDHAAGQPTYYVVDPNYLQHFQLGAKGPEADHYRRLLALLPSVFVGTADQLASMVNRLCKEMEKVFLSRGVPLPPWRSPRVMQGRWLVNQVLEDERVPATPPSTPHQQGLVLQGGRTLSAELRERLPQLAI